MRICLCTEYGTNYKAISEITVPVMKKYCERHGYEFRELVLPGTGNEYYYCKIAYFIELFKEEIDVIAYFDADILLTNLHLKIELFLDDKHDMYISKHAGEVNGGAMILKNTSWSRNFMDIILFFREDFDNEQNVIDHFENYKSLKNMKVVDHPAFNSVDYNLYPEFTGMRASDGQWGKGHFAFHVPALGTEHREQILREHLQYIVE